MKLMPNKQNITSNANRLISTHTMRINRKSTSPAWASTLPSCNTNLTTRSYRIYRKPPTHTHTHALYHHEPMAFLFLAAETLPVASVPPSAGDLRKRCGLEWPQHFMLALSAGCLTGHTARILAILLAATACNRRDRASAFDQQDRSAAPLIASER